jgi:hypothetical protein
LWGSMSMDIKPRFIRKKSIEGKLHRHELNTETSYRNPSDNQYLKTVLN